MEHGPEHSLPRVALVGRVAGLWRYPVKSMAAEALEAAEVSWHGFAGDRRWAFVRDGMARSGFPWLTARERPEMLAYRPRFADPARPDRSTTMVRTPSGVELDVVDPALAEELGPGVRVIRQDRGIFDTFPLSLITSQSVAALAEEVGIVPEVQRFRPNILVDAVGGAPFAEDAWVGRTLRIGGLRMRIDKRDQRCVMVNIDPATLARDARVLRSIARTRDACTGVYGTTVEPGSIRLGDEVLLES
jgi:uncharacterized protein YcbX